jgi:glycosyltransferase involved in cell wall biosynthesis
VKRIAIDLVPIRVGEGGAGSGIWTYARELLCAMDAVVPTGLEVWVLANEKQVPYLELEYIKLRVFPEHPKHILKRLLWVHVQLPIWCRKNRVDVLHKVATETSWFCSAKRVTTIHDFYYEYLMENHKARSLRLYERLEHAYFMFISHICFAKSQQLIAVSAATCEEAVRRHPTCEGQITTIQHGAPVIEPRSLNRKNGESFVILCVAKFMEHKGQHLLIQAFELLLKDHEELHESVKLSLRGFHNDLNYFKRIDEMIRRSPYSAAVEVIPYDASNTLEDIYADADLVVLLSDYEGFGLPILEAQSFCVPVLCSELDVLKETGGEGAVYVNRRDVENITKSILNLIVDKNYHEEMQERALKNVKRFSWVRAAQETLKVYDSVLKSLGK